MQKTKQNKTNKQTNKKQNKTKTTKKKNSKKKKKKKTHTPVNEGVLIPNFTPKYVWAQTFKPAVTKLRLFFLQIDICRFPRLKKKNPFLAFSNP